MKHQGRTQKWGDMGITPRPGGSGMLELAPSINCSKFTWTSWPPHLPALKVVYVVEKIRIILVLTSKPECYPESPQVFGLWGIMYSSLSWVLEFLLFPSYASLLVKKNDFIFNLWKLKGNFVLVVFVFHFIPVPMWLYWPGETGLHAR